MRPFEAFRFLALANVLGEISNLHPERDAVVSDDWKIGNVAALEEYMPILVDLGMDASHASLERLLILLRQPGVRFSQLAAICAELQGRLQDQAQRRLFFALSLKETKFGLNPKVGWETATARFPDIEPDVAEAGACLALSRYAASVFHSVQITEVGLVELGTFLKVKDPHSGWTAVANALDRMVKTDYSKRTAFEKRHYAALEQIQGTVQALKNAWRNKISHVQGRLVLMGTDFGSERAEEIFMATRAFMRRLAEDIPPKKVRKSNLADMADFVVRQKNRRHDSLPRSFLHDVE